MKACKVTPGAYTSARCLWPPAEVRHLPMASCCQQAVFIGLQGNMSPARQTNCRHACMHRCRSADKQAERQTEMETGTERQAEMPKNACRTFQPQASLLRARRPSELLLEHVLSMERQGASRTQAARSSPPASCRRRRPPREAGATATPPPPGGRRGPGTTSDTRLRPYCRHPALFSVKGYTS